MRARQVCNSDANHTEVATTYFQSVAIQDTAVAAQSEPGKLGSKVGKRARELRMAIQHIHSKETNNVQNAKWRSQRAPRHDDCSAPEIQQQSRQSGLADSWRTSHSGSTAVTRRAADPCRSPGRTALAGRAAYPDGVTSSHCVRHAERQ